MRERGRVFFWAVLSCSPCGLVKAGRALESVSDAWADIGRADVTFELGLLHQLGGLFASAAEEEITAGGVERIGQVADGAEACGVDGSHVAKAKDDDRWKGIQVAKDLGEFVGGSEEEWPVDAVDRCIGRNVFALQDVFAAVFDVVFRDTGDSRGPGNFSNEH